MTWQTPRTSSYRRHSLLTWCQRARERRRLRELEGHLLQDLGLTRADALREASKPFWRA